MYELLFIHVGFWEYSVNCPNFLKTFWKSLCNRTTYIKSNITYYLQYFLKLFVFKLKLISDLVEYHVHKYQNKHVRANFLNFFIFRFFLRRFLNVHGTFLEIFILHLRIYYFNYFQFHRTLHSDFYFLDLFFWFWFWDIAELFFIFYFLNWL